MDEMQKIRNGLIARNPMFGELIEGLTNEELDLYWKVLDFVIKDKGQEEGLEILADAFIVGDKSINAENMSIWLGKIKEALEMGGETAIVVPNAIDFLIKANEEYNQINEGK